MPGAAFPFPLWQREQSGCAPQDSKELSGFGGEKSGETSVPARGTGGNVCDLYQFMTAWPWLEFCVALGARQDNSCHVQQVKFPWNFLHIRT